MKALVDETLDFCAEATDKEEVQMRQNLANKRPHKAHQVENVGENVWRKKQRFPILKDETWAFLGIPVSLRPKEEVEKEFKHSVVRGLHRNREEQEKCLLECKGEAHAEDPPKRVQAKKEDGPRGLPLAWSPRTGEDSEAPNRTQALGNRVRC